MDARALVAPVRRWWHRSREFRPIFIAGAAGAGTSLLAYSLAQRFEHGVLIREAAREQPPDSLLYVDKIDSFPSLAAYGRAIRPDPGWTPEAGRDTLLGLYRSRARGEGAVAIDKGPNVNLTRAGYLARCFPEARFVLLVRDPVANLEGLRRKWRLFGKAPLEEAVGFYRTIHEAFLEQMAGFRDRVRVVAYQDLVDRHQAVLRELAGAFGLEARRRPLRIPSRANYARRGIRNVAKGRIGVVADADSRSIAKLRPEDVAAIAAALGPLQERLLYSAARE